VIRPLRAAHRRLVWLLWLTGPLMVVALLGRIGPS
jgi:hypothetical protein